jgi:hypothetical protein
MEREGSSPQSQVPATCPYPQPGFMEPEGSLPQSQVHATCPYPKPAFLMRAYVWHAYTFSTFHMQWHLLQGSQTMVRKMFQKTLLLVFQL